MSYATDTAGLFNAYGLSLVAPADGSDIEHERVHIRRHFQARLEALLADPARLHTDPNLPIEARPENWKLPALNLSTTEEESELSTTGPAQFKRTLTLVVRILASETDAAEVQDVLDQIALAVEFAVLLEVDRPPSIFSVVLDGSEPQFESEGARRFGSLTLRFSVLYYTRLPESELPRV